MEPSFSAIIKIPDKNDSDGTLLYYSSLFCCMKYILKIFVYNQMTYPKKGISEKQVDCIWRWKENTPSNGENPQETNKSKKKNEKETSIPKNK